MQTHISEQGKELAKETGWTLEYAEGYLDGTLFQRNGLDLAPYLKFDMDDYAHGFRTGYYARENSVLAA